MKHITVSNRIYFFSSLIVSIFLWGAAIGKIIAPHPFWPDLDLTVAAFEIIFTLLLLAFYHRLEMWAMTALLFAAWSGYSLFWTSWGLTCSCFGQMVHLPPGFSLVVDIIFSSAAFFLSYLLGIQRVKLFLCSTLAMAVFGFVIAHLLYFNVLFLEN
jgi:hypothetical protein